MNFYSILTIFYQHCNHIWEKMTSSVTIIAQNTCVCVYRLVFSMLQLDWLSIARGAYVVIWSVDVQFQFRVQICNSDKKTTYSSSNAFLVKQELSFGFFIKLHDVIYIYIYFVSIFCINHSGVDVVFWWVDSQWSQIRTFWKAQNHPVHVQSSYACQEVVNMLREAVFRDSLHGVRV